MIYAFPFLLLLIGLGFLAVQSRRRRGRRHFLDLGQAFVLVVVMYGLVPGVGFLLAHLGVGAIADARLSGGYDVTQVEHVQLMFLGFVVGFAVAYTQVRRYGKVAPDHRLAAVRPMRWLVGLALVLVIGMPITLGLAGVDIGADYISSYTALRDAPLIVQQLHGIATQLSFAAMVAAIVFAVAARPTRHLSVAGILGGYLVYAALAGGSRSMAFLCFFAYVVAASVYVPGFSTRRIVAAGAPALVLFMLAGLLRDDNPESNALGLFQSGEFTALFINAIDLKERFDNGFAAEVRFAFYFVDLIRLIPAQLVGGVKIDPAQWYVETFYPDYSEAGGGFAFGLLTESVAGMGVPEAIVRGALLGVVFAWAANRLIEGRPTVVKVFVYTWFVVLAYQCYRDTTLSLGVRAIYQVLPLLLFIRLARRMHWGKRRHAQPALAGRQLA